MCIALLHTARMQHRVAHWQGGNPAAADELLLAIGERLEHVTRKTLSGFPAVRVWTETANVVQGSLFRLLNLRRKQTVSSDGTRLLTKAGPRRRSPSSFRSTNALSGPLAGGLRDAQSVRRRLATTPLIASVRVRIVAATPQRKT